MEWTTCTVLNNADVMRQNKALRGVPLCWGRMHRRIRHFEGGAQITKPKIHSSEGIDSGIDSRDEARISIQSLNDGITCTLS